MSHGILNYLGAGEKRPPIENGNWNSIVWEFQLFQGPRPFRIGSRSVCRRRLLGRVCVSWYIELFAGGWKAAPIENGNWDATVWKFQLLQRPRPFRFRFGLWSVWCRHLLGRACVSMYIELFGGGGKSAPAENGTWNAIFWKFQLFHGPTPP